MYDNFKATLLIIMLLSVCSQCLAANGEALIKLDSQRNDLLKQITNELSYGHMTLVDAQRIKNELDQVVAMETKYKEGHQVQLKTIANKLSKISTDVNSAVHPQKVWMGIDNQNKALKQKIDSNFASGKLSKQEAENLEQEEQTLRAHETVNDSATGLEFDDAVAIAKEIQQLDKKIDELSNN